MDMVWLYHSPIPVGRRGLIYFSKSLEEGGRGLPPCGRNTSTNPATIPISNSLNVNDAIGWHERPNQVDADMGKAASGEWQWAAGSLAQCQWIFDR
jgi:hypothetical protein